MPRQVLSLNEVDGVSQNHLRITLVKEYFSRDANRLVSHRNLECSELQSVNPKNDRCEDLLGIRFAEIEKRRSHRGLCCISRRGDHTTHRCAFPHVIGRLLGSKGRRMTYSQAAQEQHDGEEPLPHWCACDHVDPPQKEGALI